METTNKKFIFLDRDGVINEDLFDYVKSPLEFKFIKGSLEAIIKLSTSGFQIIIVTNQACIGSGIATTQDIENVHKFMEDTVIKKGGKINRFMVCPHDKNEGCKCRKPEIGLLIEAEKQIGVNLRGVFFIGDKESDVIAALGFECIPLLVKTGYGSKTLESKNLPKNINIFRNLSDATDYVLSL